MEHKGFIPMKLSEVGKDELWIQDQIIDNASVLELGNLVIIQSDTVQQIKGRTHVLMYDLKDSIGYRVEIISGTLDESYITNSIEYWDMERVMFPALEYKVVIVTEEITPSLLNIMKLIYKPVHIIFSQFSVFIDKHRLRLHFVRALDFPKTINKLSQELREDIYGGNCGLCVNFKPSDPVNSLPRLVETTPKPLVIQNKELTGWGIG